MSETESISLREHFEMLLREMDKRLNERFESQENAIQSALKSAKEAVEKAEAATEKRFDSVNEFRALLADQQARLMTRAEFDAKYQAVEKEIADLSSRSNRSEGRGVGMKDLWGWLVGVAGLGFGAASLFQLLRK